MVGLLLERVQGPSLDLRPAVLGDLGLRPALLRLVERFTAQTGVEVTLDHSGLVGGLRPETETAAYRIAQEGRINVARHAGIGRATLSCVLGEGSVVVEVTDEGVGFEVEAPQAALPSGPIGMEEGARSTGGRLRVESRPGAGSSIVAELPLVDTPGPER